PPSSSDSHHPSPSHFPQTLPPLGIHKQHNISKGRKKKWTIYYNRWLTKYYLYLCDKQVPELRWVCRQSTRSLGQGIQEASRERGPENRKRSINTYSQGWKRNFQIVVTHQEQRKKKL